METLQKTGILQKYSHILNNHNDSPQLYDDAEESEGSSDAGGRNNVHTEQGTQPTSLFTLIYVDLHADDDVCINIDFEENSKDETKILNWKEQVLLARNSSINQSAVVRF